VGQTYTLMPKGKIELDYSLRYQYASTESIFSSTDIERHINHTIQNTIDIQYGLRDNVTTAISIPWVYVYDKTGTAAAKDASDLGDISITMNYQPFKSGGDWPTTTLLMSAILPTGRSPWNINLNQDLSTGGGFYGLSLGMSMSKPVDPAMLFGSISGIYRLNVNGISEYVNGAILNEVDPGLVFSAAIGLAYSISYALSANVQFQYGYATKTDYKFTNAATSTTPAYSTGDFIVGVGWRVSQLTTLSLSLGIGLTKDDPDFFVLFRLPFVF
jgi:hypothetical protein